MATSQVLGLQVIPLSDIQIGDTLGQGAYGRVFKVKYLGVYYAAKEIHRILLEHTGSRERSMVINSFLDEIKIGSSLSHDNIVQYRGIFYNDTSDVPIMLMELMDSSLTSYLLGQPYVSSTTKIKILHDLSLGLYYLHSQNPPIVHRDLSPNNVMIKSYLPQPVAKIGDLGVAKSIRTDSKKTMTQAPGTLHFMPPEALYNQPRYGPPMDVFSFGGIALFVINQEWPEPTMQVRTDPVTHELYAISEAERRQSYLNFPHGPVKDLILECLSNDPAVRPSTRRIEAFLSDFKKNKEEFLAQAFEKFTQQQDEVEKECLSLQIKNISTKISDDPLPIYQVPVVEKIHGHLQISKKIYGTATPGKPEKIVMVVGETGSGKSTLINGMLNYVLGVKFEDPYRFKVINEKELPQTVSQTQNITSYTFYYPYSAELPYDLTIIDTPGFGDTRGLQRDQEIAENIKQFFNTRGRTGIDHLDAVCFFAKSSDARLSPTQQYIYRSVLLVFGKDVERNVHVMLTFCDNDDDDDEVEEPKVIDALRQSNVPCITFYQFNNVALYAKNNPVRAKKKGFWVQSARAFNQFFDKLYISKSVSLILSKEVLEKREELQVKIEGLKQKISFGAMKLDQLKTDRKTVEEQKEKIKNNENFNYQRKSTRRVRVDIKGTGKFVTNCTKCNYTCHFPCTRQNADKQKCAAMKKRGTDDAYCAICPKHCSWRDHHNDGIRLKDEQYTENLTDEHLKKEYFTATAEKDKVESMIKTLELELNSVFADLMRNIRSVQLCLARLNEIAFIPYNLSQEDHINILIENERRSAEEGFESRIQYYEEAKQYLKILQKASDHKGAENIEKELERWNLHLKET